MALTAVCIGINDYPGTASDLSGCVNDANDWGDELRRRGFHVDTIFNDAATGAAIRAHIRQLVADAMRGDTIVLQFSGHGSFVPDKDGDEPDGTDECLCPYDLRRGYITDDELFELFAAKKQGVHAVMIADSCHSGTIARFAHAAAPPAVEGVLLPERRVRFLPPAAFLSPAALAPLGSARTVRRASAPARGAAITLTGCQDAEFSYDAYFNGRANGAFTYAALEALKALPKGASYRQWIGAIRKRLPSAEYPQTPGLYAPRGMRDASIFGFR